MVQPMLSENFHTPNGMSLRPSNDKMVEILKEYKGDVKIFRIHEGVLLPPSLVSLFYLLLIIIIDHKKYFYEQQRIL
jgi:hypothetical protein